MQSIVLLASDNPMSLITPDPGLYIWSTIIFGILLFLLSKYAFKPIFEGIRSRNEHISDALQSAERARAEVAELKHENEEILKQAREERSKIIREANELKSKIINEARDQAIVEAEKLMTDARREITTQRTKAMAEVKSEVGRIAADIAEQLVKKDMAQTQEQKDLISTLVKESNFN